MTNYTSTTTGTGSYIFNGSSITGTITSVKLPSTADMKNRMRNLSPKTWDEFLKEKKEGDKKVLRIPLIGAKKIDDYCLKMEVEFHRNFLNELKNNDIKEIKLKDSYMEIIFFNQTEIIRKDLGVVFNINDEGELYVVFSEKIDQDFSTEIKEKEKVDYDKLGELL